MTWIQQIEKCGHFTRDNSINAVSTDSPSLTAGRGFTLWARRESWRSVWKKKSQTMDELGGSAIPGTVGLF